MMNSEHVLRVLKATAAVLLRTSKKESQQKPRAAEILVWCLGLQNPKARAPRKNIMMNKSNSTIPSSCAIHRRRFELRQRPESPEDNVAVLSGRTGNRVANPPLAERA